MDKGYSQRLEYVVRNFSGTSNYGNLVDSAVHCYLQDDTKGLEEALSKFPTEYTLLESLVSKLKGKSVYSNLCKFMKEEGSIVKEDAAMCISSLITHTLLEMRRDSSYKVLIPNLYKKLGELL